MARPAPARLLGCTCVHAAGLHQHPAAPIGPSNGCRVGWSGAPAPVAGAPSAAYYPSGCSCAATQPAPLGHVVPPVLAAATETA